MIGRANGYSSETSDLARDMNEDTLPISFVIKLMISPSRPASSLNPAAENISCGMSSHMSTSQIGVSRSEDGTVSSETSPKYAICSGIRNITAPTAAKTPVMTRLTFFRKGCFL